MIDLFKKSVYVGMGLAFAGTDKISAFAEELKEKAKLSEEEGKRLLANLRERSAEAKAEFDAKVEEKLDNFKKNFRCPCTKEVETLKSRIAELEALLAKEEKSDAEASDEKA